MASGKKLKMGSQKQYVDPRLFGTELANQHPDSGFGSLSIVPENLSQVMGICPHWSGELVLRKNEVLNWENRSLQQRVFGAMKKSRLSSSFYGADLKDTVQLKNPQDALARLNLADKISKKDVVTPDINRNMLLQATLAMELHSEVTPDMLGIYRKIQSTYLNRVTNFCEDIRKQFPDSEDLDPKDKLRLKNANRTRGIVREYHSYIKSEISEALTALKSGVHKTQMDPSKKKNENIQNYMNAIKVLKFFPLLLPMTQQLSQQVVQLDRNHPIGYFLSARVYKAEAKFLTIQYTNDYAETAIRNQINTHLQQMVKSYKDAMDKIKGKYDGLYLELLDEYVSAVTTFYSDVSKIIGAKVRPEFFSNTYRVLMAASSSDSQGSARIEGFIETTRNVMNQWGVPIPG